MAIVKCKYIKYRCGNGFQYGMLCTHHDYGFNEDEYDGFCEYGCVNPKWDEQGEDGTITVHIPYQCKYVYDEVIMFEKNIKCFELNDEELIMGRKSISTARIKRLVIDDETIIQEDA